MSDYIPREAAVELLSQPITMSLCLSVDECHHKIAQQRIDRYLIENIPAADVRPVVLCRDCKNNYNTCLNHGVNEPMCDFTDRKLREDDFCSRGEKREES